MRKETWFSKLSPYIELLPPTSINFLLVLAASSTTALTFVSWLGFQTIMDLLYWIFINPFVALTAYALNQRPLEVVDILTLIGWTGAIGIALSVKFLFAQGRRKKEAEPLVSKKSDIGQLFLLSGQTQVILSSITLVVLTGWTSIVERDLVLTILASSCLIGVISHRLLTELRVRRGWFGENKIEAEELLSFITKKGRAGGLPPGTTALARPSTSTRSVVRSEDVAEGARA